MEQREGDHLRDKKELEDKLANLEEVCVPVRVRCVIHVARAYGYVILVARAYGTSSCRLPGFSSLGRLVILP